MDGWMMNHQSLSNQSSTENHHHHQSADSAKMRKHKLPDGSSVCAIALALTLHLAHLTGSDSGIVGAEAQQQGDSRAAQASNQQQQQNKIGLAPHDRPACQLPSLQLASQQRRQLQAAAGSSLDLLEATELSLLNNNSSPTNNLAQLLRTTKQQANSNSVATGRQQQQQFDSSERLRLLRGLLAQSNQDAYLVGSSDEHGSEYVADTDRRLKFISGFTGSSGFALVLLDRAVLFTDGRYALQADQDLDCNWWLVVGDNPLADIHLWLKANAARGIRVSAAARLMSMQSYDFLDEQIRSLGSKFELSPQDLVDEIRDKLATIYDLSGPAAGPNGGRQTQVEPLFVHPLQFAGNVSWQEKVVRLVDSMTRVHRARHYVISQLDEVAWLLNLRGHDIPQSPLFKAYIMLSVRPASTGGSSNNNNQPADGAGPTLISKSSQRLNPVEQLQQTLQQQQHLGSASQFVRLSLFVDLRKIDQQVWNHLRVNNISVIQSRSAPLDFGPLEPQLVQQQAQNLITTRIQVDLEDYGAFIKEFGDRLGGNSNAKIQGRLLLNAAANVAIHALAKDYEDRLVLVDSLVGKLKAVKSDGEVQGMRLAHWRDSLAISMLLAQLEADIGATGKHTNRWTEVSAARELEFYRSLMDYNRGQSFDTISAYGPNGAVVHYRPNYESAAPERQVSIGNESTYLLDSGGQYLDGTTDITRTVHFGEPTELQRETYTRVLMGSIDMMSLIFEQPKRSPYRLSDLLARRHLFELGLDYGHGTGHGIGLFSLVHEAPALIEHYSSFASSIRQQQQQVSKTATGPQVESDPVLLQANMFSSVEPGYYKPNEFGIRLENIVVTQPVNLKSSLSRPNDRLAADSSQQQQQQPQQPQQQRHWLRFEPISLVPFEPKLIKLELMSNKQKAWLNSYNLMVRLRMTQQINHYLSKMRNAPPTSGPTPAEPASASASTSAGQPIATVRAASSQLHQPLLGGGGGGQTGTNRSELGQLNYLRLEPARLQEKLELTHKWIMSKTELIPLDVPQSLIAGADQRHRPAQMFGRKRGDPATAASSQPPTDPMNGQRLMLAYMSSMPFNDPEAGQAMASLNQQDQEQRRLVQLEVRADNSSGSSVAAGSDAELGNKCQGFECDIWLVSALNSHPSGSSSSSPSRFASGGPPSRRSDGWPEAVGAAAAAEGAKVTGGEWLDLFTIKDSGGAASMAANGFGGLSAGSVWSIAVLSLIVVLQLGIMALMCSGASGKLRSNTGRRRNWCPSGSIEGPSRGANVPAPLRSAVNSGGGEHAEMRQESMA